MAAPGWPKADTIPEASVVQIDADGSHHGSHHGSRHGSHHGSAHGGSSYVQALQVSRDAGNAAKLERRASRRLENAVLGVNDWDQDYTDDYPKERDDQAAVDEKTKTHDYNPGQIIIAYFKKWKGGMDEAMPVPPILDMLISYLGAFLGILWVAGCAKALDQQLHEHILVASLGATAVLLYGVMESKLAQPRNVIGGHVVSAAVGCAFRLALPGAASWVAAPLAMATALLAMQWTRTTHPPGGATAIIASQVQPLPPWHGFSFIVVVLVASTGMTLIAMVTNNLHYKKRYPTFWFGFRKPEIGISWH